MALMEATRRHDTVTASPASVSAAAGNLAEQALHDVRQIPLPEIDPTKKVRVAVVSVTVRLEVRDK